MTGKHTGFRVEEVREKRERKRGRGRETIYRGIFSFLRVSLCVTVEGSAMDCGRFVYFVLQFHPD